MITIINYGVRNLGNIVRTMEHTNMSMKIVSASNKIKDTKKIFLHDLGQFGWLSHVLEQAKSATSGSRRIIIVGHAFILTPGNLFAPHRWKRTVSFCYSVKSEPKEVFSMQEQV